VTLSSAEPRSMSRVENGQAGKSAPAAVNQQVIKQLTIYEDYIIDRVAAGHSIIGLYPMTRPENEPLFARWRAEKGR
jgi:hypothetical protein